MTIRDGLVEEATKALNGESFKLIEFFAVSGSTVEEPPSSTAFPGQIGDRLPTARSRLGDTITFNAVRSSVDVVDITDGDDLNQVALTFLATGDETAASTPINEITHTINFDLELIAELKVSR